MVNDGLRQWRYPSREEAQRQRRARHKRWISSLSERDWERLRMLGRQVTPNYTPARLDDLDAPFIAVGLCLVGEESRQSGERIGTIRVGTTELAVLVWLKR